MPNVPTIEDFERARVTNPNQSEVIKARLYDYQLYPAAGTPQLNFFQNPIGQGITTAIGAPVGSAKTKFDTNMTLPGQLSSGLQFLPESIEVLFFPGSSGVANTFTPAAVNIFTAALAAATGAMANDVNTFYQSGRLEFNVLNKNYVSDAPLIAFPPKAHLANDSSAAATVAAGTANLQTITKAGGRAWYLENCVLLQPGMNFEVVLQWPAVVPTPSTFNGKVGVILDGWLQRASQ